MQTSICIEERFERRCYDISAGLYWVIQTGNKPIEFFYFVNTVLG